MANYLLGDKAKQIFASKYQFHLPSEKQLEAELKRELKQLKHDAWVTGSSPVRGANQDKGWRVMADKNQKIFFLNVP